MIAFTALGLGELLAGLEDVAAAAARLVRAPRPIGIAPGGGRIFKRADVVNPKFRDRADFVNQVAGAVRRVAPEFGLERSPTDAFIASQMALETGWGAAARGWNLGGVKGQGTNWRGDVFASATHEWLRMPDGAKKRVAVTALFRAFDSPDDYLRRGFLALMVATKPFPRYARALAKLRAGDDDFPAELGRCGYYTAEPTLYAAAWRGILRTVQPILAIV